MRILTSLFVLALFGFILLEINAFKSEDFRKCQDSSFCKRNRALNRGQFPYVGLPNSFVFKESSVEGDILSESFGHTLLNFEINFFNDKTLRFKLREKPYIGPNPAQTKPAEWNEELDGQWEADKIQLPLRERFEPIDALAVTEKELKEKEVKCVEKNGNKETGYLEVSCPGYSVILAAKPFRLEFVIDGKTELVLNQGDLLYFEAYSKKGQEFGVQSSKVEGIPKENLWEENFKSHPDTKPHGPSSVGLDLWFPASSAIFGIPQRTTGFALKATRKGDNILSDPYRLYNLDVFEYDIPNTQGLYGAIPFIISHNAETGSSVGALWFNAAETFVDVDNSLPNGLSTHWFSESGTVDVFLFGGSSASDVLRQFTALSGRTPIPPLFSVSYHQCRWNYNDEDDVRAVDAGFDTHNIPYDVLWLDIEHTDSKKYFTWDKSKFPDPTKMFDDLASRGRKMVTIIDPHIKADSNYNVYEDAKSLDLYVKTHDGKRYEGHCWPGASSWIDYLNPESRKYWANLFTKYEGATESLYTWNDMNEPSVFSGPEITMHKDALHFGGWEHRDVHNMYGFYMTMATHLGHTLWKPNLRPFILSRAFYTGSQRYCAIWTGDNTARWEHLAQSVPMLLAISISGLPFAGADVGGFFQNPDPELLVRWYQTAAFQPFFRGHAHIDTKRREPWLFGEENTDLIRTAIRRRYVILPYIYSLFYETSLNGSPVMRPLWFEFPTDKTALTIEDQFLLGPALMIKPVAQAGQTSSNVYLPSGIWYDISNVLGGFPGTYLSSNGGYSTISSPKETIPVLLRGGYIVPTRERARRSSAQMLTDPVTLLVALDSSKQNATGQIYLDDGLTFDYQKDKAKQLTVNFAYDTASSKLTSTPVKSTSGAPSFWGTPFPTTTAPFLGGVRVERVVILGLSKCPKFAMAEYKLDAATESSTLDVECEGSWWSTANRVIIRKPWTTLGVDWSLQLHY